MRKWALASCSRSPRTPIVSSPIRRAPARSQVLYHGIHQTPRSQPRCRSLPALSKGHRDDRETGRQKSPGSSRLRDEEAPLPRSRKAWSRQGFFRAKTSRCRTDIRIEYEARDGERARVDLELATSHYRGGNLAEKVRAGFSIYAHAEDALKLRRVLDQHKLTAEILSL